MRLLQCDLASSYPLARAGGHRTVHSLLLHLSHEAGIDCMSLYPRRGLGSVFSQYDPKLTDFQALGIRGVDVAPDRWSFDCGYPVWSVDRVEDYFGRCLDEFRPDVVWSNSFLSLPVLETARKRGLAAIWYVHDCRPEAKDLRKAAKLGIGVLAVSNFIRDRIARVSGHRCDVVYPLVTESDYIVERASPDCVTFINPRPVKGYDIFLSLVPLLPEVRFLVLEAWPLGPELAEVEARLDAFPNVEFVRQLADPREVYARTRLLLVPSVVEEGGPRVIREAQLNGIPVLGSPRGGVPEMIGDAGRIVAEYEVPAAWARAIRELLGDRDHYQHISRAALLNAHRDELTTSGILRRFAAALSGAETGMRKQGVAE
jgi:glycosyltransferase involved in cell wall biosynthesis